MFSLKPLWSALQLAALAVAATSSAQASVSTIYSSDFDGNTVIQPGLGGSYGSFQNGTALGSYTGSDGKVWGGNFLHNAIDSNNPSAPVALTFSLNNLMAHTAIRLDFMLGFLDSWDSSNGSPAPDFLSIAINGGTPFLLTTNIASGSVSDFAGGTRIVNRGQIDSNQFYSDDLVDMGTASFLTFAHTGSSLTFTITAAGAGWQGGTDEGWGIDDLRILAITNDNTVPEPSTLALLGLALGAGMMRRRRSAD